MNREVVKDVKYIKGELVPNQVEGKSSPIYNSEINYEYLNSIQGNLEALYEYIDKEFIQDKYRNKIITTTQQCKVMMKVCEVLGIIPSYDQFIFIMADYKYVNNQALPGAGKTVISLIRCIKETILERLTQTPSKKKSYWDLRQKSLVLVYNEEAEKDCKLRYSDFTSKYNKYYLPIFKKKYRLELSDRKIDLNYIKDNFLLPEHLEAYTFHSFAYSWLLEYNLKYPKIVNIDTSRQNFLLQELDCIRHMSTAFDMWAEDQPADAFSNFQSKQRNLVIKALVAVYQWSVETLDTELKTVETNSEYKNIREIIKDTKDIELIFKYYRKIKEKFRVIDFSDVLDKFYTLLQQPEVLARIRTLYKHILFDEFQDVSNNMLRSIKLIADGDVCLNIPRGEDIKLTIIGDIDQCLYTFRGVSVDNSLKFKEIFGNEDSKIISLSLNRRSLSPIIEFSKSIIEHNTQRIDKPIVAVRESSLLEIDEGKSYEDCEYKAVELRSYLTEVDYTKEIVENLKAMSVEERGQTAILYRNRSSSVMVALELFKAGIPFIVNKGISPFEDLYSKSILEILYMCANPSSFYSNKLGLLRTLPKGKGFTTATISAICDKEQKAYDSDKNADARKKFWEYDFGSTAYHKQVKERLKSLQEVSSDIYNDKSMLVIINKVDKLLDKNSLMFSENMPAEYLLPVLKENFMVDKSYFEFKDDLDKKMSELQDITSVYTAVKLTTFHSTKGLEYNTVYLIDLKDSIFPGRELKNDTNTTISEPSNGVTNAIESCRRLFYVAATRARNKLVLYIDKKDPSRFIEEVDSKFIPTVIQQDIEDSKIVKDPQSSKSITTSDYALLIQSTNEKVESEEVVKAVERSASGPFNLQDIFNKSEFSASETNYLQSLNIAKLECNGITIEGYYDGFIHQGDLLYDRIIKARYKTKIEKAEKLFGSDILKAELGNQVEEIESAAVSALFDSTSIKTANKNEISQCDSENEIDLFS